MLATGTGTASTLFRRLFRVKTALDLRKYAKNGLAEQVEQDFQHMCSYEALEHGPSTACRRVAPPA